MRTVLNRVLIGTIERLALEFVLGLRQLFRPIDLLDHMALRAGHPIQRRVAGFGLIDEELGLIGEFPHVRGMTAKALGFVFPCGRRQKDVERGAKGRGMDRARERRSFPLFEHTLMATLALTGTRKGLFDGTLRHREFFCERSAVEPVSEKQRTRRDHRTDTDLQRDRVSDHHASPSASRTPSRTLKKAVHHTKTVIWFVWFIWLNQTNQMDQTNQTNRAIRVI